MGTFSVWHWLIVLLYFGIPAAAVATEKSGNSISRIKFLYWVLGWIAYSFIAIVGNGLVAAYRETPSVLFWYFGLNAVFALAYWVLFYRALVKRLRDTGKGKGLAYAAVLPFLNVLVPIYLLFATPRTAQRTEADAKFG